jgi:hypothetical protein
VADEVPRAGPRHHCPFTVLRSRSFLTVVLAVAAAVAGPAAAARAAAPLPEPTALGSGWSFAPDPGDRGLAARWQESSRLPRARAVTLPHVFDGRPDEARFGGTVGWYSRALTVPDAPAGFGWAIRFEQVRRAADVFLDGREIARLDDPYVPHTVALGALRPGSRHRLTLRVDNRKGREPREGWWNWGGLTRPAELVPLGPVVLHDSAVLPQVTCDGPGSCRAAVIVDGVLENRTSQPVSPNVEVTLRAPGSGAETSARHAVRVLAPGERAPVRFAVAVQGKPELWAPDSPALYDADVTTRAGEVVAARDRSRIGLRSVRVRGGMLELNGRALELRGGSIQEDAPGRGPALTGQDMDAIVDELRQVGANVTRAHYLLNDALLRRFDEAGILVWSQAPIYHRDVLLRTPGQRAKALGTVRGTVLAARRHPSVMTHSVANELSPIPNQLEPTARFLRSAAALTRALDPTVPVSVDMLSYPGIERQEAFAHYDLLGINSYFGWYEGKPERSTARLEDLRPFLEGMRAKYPGQALVLTEFGAEATADGPPGQKQTFAFQADYLDRVLGIVRDAPYVGGAIYWTMREFAVKPDWDGGAHPAGDQDAIHNKGLISYDGRRKPAWAVARRAFETTPVYRDAASARALAVPSSRSRDAVAWSVAALVLALLLLDTWALRGILRAARRRAMVPALDGEDEFSARRRRVVRAA